jgi:hypothetical protein
MATRRRTSTAPRSRLEALTRRHAELGGLDLFSRLDGESAGPITDAERLDAVVREFRSGVVTSLQNPARLHGWHAQIMFAQVVRALGHAVLLAEEDMGATWARTTDYVRPGDYRVVLDDGTNLAVEVKNHAAPDLRRPFRMRADDLAGLARYAELTRSEPRIALYWTGPGLWFLVRPERFTTSGRYATITVETAMAESEMASLGDELIGTVPPLELSFRFKEVGSRSRPDSDGRREATAQIRGVAISAGGRQLTTRAGQRLAFYLMWNGKWAEHQDDVFERGELRRVSFRYEPEDWPHPQGFAFLGWHSELVARSFVLRTSEDGVIRSLRAELDPAAEGLVIPDPTASEFRLWRMRLQPRSAAAP